MADNIELDQIKSICLRKKFWLKDLLHGSPVRRVYDNVRYFDTHSPEECRSFQDAALRRIIDIAVRDTSFYADRLLVDVSQIEGQEGRPLQERHTTGSTGIKMYMKFSHQ